MNLAARVLVALVVAAGSASMAATAGLGRGDGLGSVVVLVAVAVLEAASYYKPLFVLRGDDNDAWHCDDIVLAFGLVLLPPLGVTVAFVAGVATGMVASRTPPVKAAFNVAVTALGIGAAVGLYHGLGGPTGPEELALGTVGLVLAASAAYSISGRVLVAAVLRFAQGTPWVTTLTEELGVFALQWACFVSIGLLVVLAATAAPWAPVLAVTPVALVYVVLRESLRAHRDRERMAGINAAALEAHKHVSPDDVAASVTASTQALLSARRAAISAEPPGPGEIGVALPLSTPHQRWLVAGDPKRLDGFEEADRELLGALGAVATPALENALLVDQIRHQATHDPLTALPNQLVFDDRTEQALARAQRHRERVAVMVLDLDAFKKVNESLGHSAGNDLLIEVGSRLASSVREVDTVARMSGDQFTILLPGIGTGATVELMAERMLTALRRPFVVADNEVYMTASIGIAVFPDDGSGPGELLRNAEAAMHRSKEVGGNASRLYDAAMNEKAHVHLQRQSELHNALRRDELRVRYQPQVDLRTGRIIGVEALVRWQHPAHGLLAPIDFVPLAEESDLILDVDMWVLRQACLQARAWEREHLPALRIAVNLSGRHFLDDRVVRRVAAVLDDTGLPAERLELEVTESVAVRENEGTLGVLRRVRDLGVQLAIDDFGTGYSALAQMQRFPVDRLKIDRTFVNQIIAASGPAPLVSAFIAIARALHLDVLAEGVETIEQQTFLRNHGCREAQGFLYSRPVEPDEVARLVRSPSLGLAVGIPAEAS